MSIEITSKAVENYCTFHSDDEPSLLRELGRETRATVVNARMLVGRWQGRLMAMLSKMMAPKRILEVGTFTGYSTMCLAEGLPEDGHLHTIEIDPELADFPKRYWDRAGLEGKITHHIGDALQILPSIDETFDLAFLDGDKKEYKQYLELILPKLRTGGILFTDNVLWKGKVVDTSETDGTTQAIRSFNTFVEGDERLEKVLLPVRDGLYLLRKK